MLQCELTDLLFLGVVSGRSTHDVLKMRMKMLPWSQRKIWTLGWMTAPLPL